MIRLLSLIVLAFALLITPVQAHQRATYGPRITIAYRVFIPQYGWRVIVVRVPAYVQYHR
jgi:hypothetical protein